MPPQCIYIGYLFQKLYIVGDVNMKLFKSGEDVLKKAEDALKKPDFNLAREEYEKAHKKFEKEKIQKNCN